MNLLVCSGICDVSDSLNERCAALEVQLTTVQEENTRLRAAIEPDVETRRAYVAAVERGLPAEDTEDAIALMDELLHAIRARAGENIKARCNDVNGCNWCADVVASLREDLRLARVDVSSLREVLESISYITRHHGELGIVGLGGAILDRLRDIPLATKPPTGENK